jgi:hypothetical protein
MRTLSVLYGQNARPGSGRGARGNYGRSRRGPAVSVGSCRLARDRPAEFRASVKKGNQYPGPRPRGRVRTPGNPSSATSGVVDVEGSVAVDVGRGTTGRALGALNCFMPRCSVRIFICRRQPTTSNRGFRMVETVPQPGFGLPPRVSPSNNDLEKRRLSS